MTLSLRRQVARGQSSEYLRKNASGRSAHYDELTSREGQQATTAQRQELAAMSQSYWQGEPSQEGHNAEDRAAEVDAQRKTRAMQTLADIYERWYAAGIISPNEPNPQQMLRQLQRDAEQLKAGAKAAPAQSQPSLDAFARDYWRGDNRTS